MDDALVVCAADDVGILELRINESLWRAKRWLDIRCLKMAPEKTEALLVTDWSDGQMVSANRTVSTSAVLVLASVPPIDLLAEERKETFQLRKELTCLTNLQEIARAKEAIGKDGRCRLVEKWQTRWHRFYLTQELSGHGCFNAYLKRFKKRDDESCRYCGSLVDNAKHTHFVCARWGVAREAASRSVGAQLTPDTMISLMPQSEQKWVLIESFVTMVMKTRELDGRAERGDNEGQ